MANYRFKTAEIEAMKQNILTHIEHEAETKTAWRLRCAIEGQLMCCRPSKREAARLERELALYEKLTKNDLPNWQGEPTQSAKPAETPQISTGTAETVNVSAEDEKKAERAENKSKAERMKSKYDITEQLERIRVTFLSLPDWDLEPRLGRMALAEDICKRYLENINQHLGLYDETEFCRYSDLKIPQSVYAAPQSPETPQTKECTVEGDKSDSKHARAITMLNAKLVKLQNEAHKYDDCNRLSRKLYFSDAKRQVRIGEQCTAIEAALALLNGKQWHELDIYNVVLMSVNSRNSEKDKMLEYAYSGGLYEKQKALMYAFETSLPICKKQIFEVIQMQIKSSRLAQTA